MKRGLLVVMALVASCAPFKEPSVQEREVPGAGGDPPAYTARPFLPDAAMPEPYDAGCCFVRFARAAGDELAAELLGFSAPLSTPLRMTRDGGIWEATACMPRTNQSYGYRVFIPLTEDGGALFPLVVTNPNAPQVPSSEYGVLNEFRAADAGSCADIATAPHADTTVVDAGAQPVVDAGSDAGLSDAGSDGG